MTFNPNFTFVDTITEAADTINKPHEDYPARVDLTRQMIDHVMNYIACDAPYNVHEFVLRAIHQYVMYDLDMPGFYRLGNVRVGHDSPPDYSVVPNLMRDLHPYSINGSIERLKEWYTQFETIHPFIDGNGRVGGVIIAAFSIEMCGKFLVPCQ